MWRILLAGLRDGQVGRNDHFLSTYPKKEGFFGVLPLSGRVSALEPGEGGGFSLDKKSKGFWKRVSRFQNPLYVPGNAELKSSQHCPGCPIEQRCGKNREGNQASRRHPGSQVDPHIPAHFRLSVTHKHIHYHPQIVVG